MKSPTQPQDDVQQPAVLRPHHAQIRVISPVAGAKKGWAKLSMIDLAYEHEKFGPRDSEIARARRDAGLAYAVIFDTAQGGTADSTQALNGSRGAGGGIPISIAQIEAFKQLGIIAGMMGARDGIIVRKFCGEGMTPAEAVRLAGCDEQTRVTGKIRDVMDDLAMALSGLRRPANYK